MVSVDIPIRLAIVVGVVIHVVVVVYGFQIRITYKLTGSFGTARLGIFGGKKLWTGTGVFLPDWCNAEKRKNKTKIFLLSDSVDQERRLYLLLAAFFSPHAPITCKDAYSDLSRAPT